MNKRFVVVSLRRSGASGVYRLLKPFVRADDLGMNPFSWVSSYRGISLDFSEGRKEQSRKALMELLDRNVYFCHYFDTQDIEFDRQLFYVLQQKGYSVISVKRRDIAARIFSTMIAEHFDCWSAEQIARLTARLSKGNASFDVDTNTIRRQISNSIFYSKGIDQLLTDTYIDKLEVDMEDLFRSGISGLNVLDQMFEFSGLGERKSQLNDETALKILSSGEQYTHRILQYSNILKDLRVHIRKCLEELDFPF